MAKFFHPKTFLTQIPHKYEKRAYFNFLSEQTKLFRKGPLTGIFRTSRAAPTWVVPRLV